MFILADIVKVIEDSKTPAAPLEGQCLGEIDGPAETRGRGAKSNQYARNNEHRYILGCSLQDDGKDGDQRRPKQRRASANPIGKLSIAEARQTAPDPDGRRVQRERRGVEMEIVSVRGQYVQTVNHGCIVAKGLRINPVSADRVR